VAGRLAGRAGVAALVLLAAAGPIRSPLAAQLEVGDSAWNEGRFEEARVAYEHALTEDPNSVHASYRLALMLAWNSQHDSALALLRRARLIEPDDPDLHFTEAQVLSWQGHYAAAVLHFDSLLAKYPTRRDAVMARAQVLAWDGRFEAADSAYAQLVIQDPNDLQARAGQARVAAWRGDYPQAIARFSEILSRDPANPEALTGLAQVYHWQGRDHLAKPLVDQVLAQEPSNHDAQRLRGPVHAGLRPQLEGTLGWSHDSDQNVNWWQSASASQEFQDGIHGVLTAGLLEGSDPSRRGTRTLLEAGASYATGLAEVVGALGLRVLSPQGESARTFGSYRLSGSYWLSPAVSVGLGYAHFPMDESALLIASGPLVDALDANVESRLPHRLSLTGTAGLAWFSDNNRRRSAILTVVKSLQHGITAGGFARVMGYDFKGTGYFSPDRFALVEARASYSYVRNQWHGRVSAGLGGQQIGKEGGIQGAGHLEVRIVRTWAAINQVAFDFGITNSAASSTTGAFGYQTAGVYVRIGL